MKKFFILIAMLIPLILLSQGQQPTASSEGFNSQGGQFVPSGTRSIPPGTVVWSQPPECAENLYACQLAVNYPFDAKIADDFLFSTATGPINAVRWWVGWWSGSYVAPSSFNIIIFDDNDCTPGNVVGTWSIPYADANEDAACVGSSFDGREYWAELNPPFVPVTGQHYWITTQAVVPFPPQTGIYPSATANLCNARQDFPVVGLYWATPPYHDFSFELYASAPVPVSTWALALGGVLIAAGIFLRYRRVL